MNKVKDAIVSTATTDIDISTNKRISKPYILLMLMLMFMSRLFSLEHKLHLLMLTLILASQLGLGLNEGERRR